MRRRATEVEVWTRQGGRLSEVNAAEGWTGPLLGARFAALDGILMFHPDGRPFLSFAELMETRDAERLRADLEREKAGRALQRADALAARLRALGVDPDA